MRNILTKQPKTDQFSDSLSAAEKASLLDMDTLQKALRANNKPVTELVKQTLKRAEQQMNEWFRQERSIIALVHGRSWLLDQLIVLLWRQCIDTCYKNSSIIQPSLPPPSLFATGGYGRKELHPHSDIDLLVLTENETDENFFAGAIKKFITWLWDIGLKVGTAVRTLAQSSSLAKNDISVLTSLMEARLLSGNIELYTQLQKSIAPSVMWSGHHYLQAKYAEQKKRHIKYNQTSYNLEPDIKESPGGLRDIHMILWVLQRHYNHSGLVHLVELGFLFPEECLMLQRARNILWTIRWALHTISGRAEDRLLFDYQKTLAAQMGFKDIHDSLAIEQFMQVYFRVVTDIATLKDVLIQHYHDDILLANTDRTIVAVNDRFQLCNQYLEITRHDVFKQHPPAIFEAFVIITYNSSILGARASTIRALRSNLELIDDNFRQNKEVISLFMKLLRAPYGLSSALRKMTRYGILGRYLPEFAHITGQMQYDLFHIYTVEAHTLLLIKFLRKFRYKSHKEYFPLAYEVHKALPAPELLYIAALYHDIAKGRGGNHSELGAEEARIFCQRHLLSQQDSDLVVWLVKYHLKLSATAQRKDLSDEQVLFKFARFVGCVDRLNYLYCLTVADINATNPKLWNNWRGSLLNQLYYASKKILLHGTHAVIEKDKKDISQIKAQAETALKQQGADTEKALRWWNKAGDSYLSRYSVDEIIWHTEHFLKQKNEQTPFVIVRNLPGQPPGGTAVFIYTPYTPETLAAVASKLERLGFNIMDAQVIISEHYFCMDTFIVLDADNSFISSDSSQIRQACYQLQQYLKKPMHFKQRLQRKTPRLLRYFSQPPQIKISQDTTRKQTEVQIFATDRPGLLAIIVDIFSTYKIRVQKAKILTLGERVEDIFLITTHKGGCVTDPELLNRLTAALTQSILRHAQKDCYPSISKKKSAL